MTVPDKYLNHTAPMTRKLYDLNIWGVSKPKGPNRTK
jgi:hypothetical protein